MQRKKRGYSEDGNVNEMLVKFILQNGKTEYRRYFILDDVWNAAEEKLWQQSWYQKLCYPILSDDPQYAEKKLTEVNLSYFYGDDCVMDGEDAKEVYRIYRKELTEKTMQEIKTIPSEEKNFAADTENMDGYNCELYFSFEEKTKTRGSFARNMVIRFKKILRKLGKK